MAEIETIEGGTVQVGPQPTSGGSTTSDLTDEETKRVDAILGGKPEDTTKTGGGGGGGSSGGGGGSSAGARASAEALLRRWGLPVSLVPWMVGLMRQGYGTDAIINELFKRPEFKAKFPGITRSDGSLIVSPTEYLQLADSYRDIAGKYGISGLTNAQIGQTVGGELSPDEADVRLRGVQNVMQNAGALGTLNAQIAQENKERAARGLPPIPTLKNATDALNFALGQSDTVVYELYESTYLQQAAKSAGLELSVQESQRLATKTAGLVSPEQAAKSYQNIKRQIDFAGVELRSFGISRADQEALEFGLPAAPGALARLEQAMKQRQAALQTVQAQQRQGLSGARPVVPGLEETGF